VAAEEGRFEDEGWRLRKDGTAFWANVIITALRSQRGDLVGFAKVTRDLTERRAAQLRALADARRVAEAEAANSAKADFLAAMSHELRTPLNAIGGYAELMAMGLRGPVTAEQQEDLERIRRSQRHLLAIVNDLLNFSRIEAWQISYEIGAVPLHETIRAVAPMIEPQAAAKGLQFTFAECPPQVAARADRAKLEQILLNLLSNAVKFTDRGGRITLSCRRAGDRAEITVSDTGCGIAADQLTAIFEPFVQIGRSLTQMREGTGLGLAISRDLARAMKGELTVRSELDVGSHFTLALPAA
jgi:signal transduction histidine kinase